LAVQGEAHVTWFASHLEADNRFVARPGLSWPVFFAVSALLLLRAAGRL
jgi:hypothetical protein